MTSFSDWKVPAAFQPKTDAYEFDLDETLRSVLSISSIVRKMPSPPPPLVRSGRATPCSSGIAGWP